VFVNANDTAARRRFTLAHEVGHWICQCLKGRGVPVMCRAEDVSSDADLSVEREASAFGAELLMPEGAVRQHSTDPDAASVLGVSQLVMDWRLYSFDLAPAPIKIG
jgi:Zn-dependent peptidase ImmA (M78 family)